MEPIRVNRQAARRRPWRLLPATIALALAACGGGGGGGTVRSDPPPPPPAPVPDFTPTVAIDASLTKVNPPAIPSRLSPLTWAAPNINRHLIVTNAAGALGAGLTGQGVTIGFVDTGVNGSHPALSGRVAANFVHVDPATNDTSVDDVVGHGTTVASLAAGAPVLGNYLDSDGTNSGQTDLWGGGIAQSATVVASRIINDQPPVDDGSGEGNQIGAGQGYGEFFRAINAELADAGARIINNSWGGLYWDDPALSLELATAWKDFVVDRGGLVVFANGNSGEDPRYAGNPSDNAALPSIAGDAALEKGWLTVGAVDPASPTSLTSYSQQCGIAMAYCLVAPGDVVFTDPAATSQAEAGLYQGSGTSYAAPLVSGTAAVVWSAFPYFTNDQVRQAILGGAKDIGAYGVDPVFGWGLLDVTAAANGPSRFDWGDFSVAFSGTSVWRNVIRGDGGLIKAGPGTLILTESPSYSGNTLVEEGSLYLAWGLARSNLHVSQGATVWAADAVWGVENDGTYIVAIPNGVSVAVKFSQSETGNLGLWLGNPLMVPGTAKLAGQVSILGGKIGYTTSAREKLIEANAIEGAFSTLKAAPNVFLDASLAYDPTHVFLDITRINVAKAVAGLGLSELTQGSAQRVEAAMQQIDGQLAGTAPAAADAAFIEAAGALQQSAGIAQADAALRSLSGELHAASAAMTFDAIDGGRRALDGRLDALARGGAAGGWYRDLAAGGTLARAGYDGIGTDAAGQLIGNDWRLGDSAVVGIALDRQFQSSWLSAFGDRSRGTQRQLQLYAAAWRGPWYGQLQLAGGGFDRQLQRNLLLGARRDAVGTRLSGRTWAASAELGRRFELAGTALVPYAGTQAVRVANDGFDEGGSTGFGLRAEAWDAHRWQGFAGLRASRAWRVGGVDLAADARAEWQRTLSSGGALFQASFGGLEQWAPLEGIGLARDTRSVGLGLSAELPSGARFRFDLDRRRSDVGSATMATLQAQLRF
jgi:autotransporter-associated beta strand protein